jgi:galactose mutarotase-like enzyme
MPKKSWTLIDQAKNLRVDDLTIRPSDVGGSAKDFSVSVRTLRAGLSEQVMVVHVDNGTLSYDLLPTRGMGIWKAWIGGEEIGWRSPVRGPVHPNYVNVGEPSGLGWLDGFDELLVRCGLESNGAPEFDEKGLLKYPLHGRIANRPAHRCELTIDGDQGIISVTGEVDESRFHFAKLRLASTVSTQIRDPGLRLHDEIRNLSQSPAEAQLLYHINFGLPLLDAGARLVAPAKMVVPRTAHAAEAISSWDSFAAEQPGFAEQVYFFEMFGEQNKTQVLLKNAHGTRGVSLSYNTKQLPCFTLWKDTAAAADGYVTGLEPGTNFPNPRSFEGKKGRVVKLGAGEKAEFDLAMHLHVTAADVETAEKAVTKLRGGNVSLIHSAPLPDWCAP